MTAVLSNGDGLGILLLDVAVAPEVTAATSSDRLSCARSRNDNGWLPGCDEPRGRVRIAVSVSARLGGPTSESDDKDAAALLAMAGDVVRRRAEWFVLSVVDEDTVRLWGCEVGLKREFCGIEDWAATVVVTRDGVDEAAIAFVEAVGRAGDRLGSRRVSEDGPREGVGCSRAWLRPRRTCLSASSLLMDARCRRLYASAMRSLSSSSCAGSSPSRSMSSSKPSSRIWRRISSSIPDSPGDVPNRERRLDWCSNAGRPGRTADRARWRLLEFRRLRAPCSLSRGVRLLWRE